MLARNSWSPSKYVASCCTVIIRGTQLAHSYTAGTIIAICLVVVNITLISHQVISPALTRAGSALRTHLRPGYKERRTGREWKGRKVRVYSLACGKLTWSAVTKTADQWSCRVNLPAWLMASRPSLLIHFKLTTFSATRLWFLSALLTLWHVEEVQGSSQFKMNTYRVYFSSMRHRSTKRQALETNPFLFCILLVRKWVP